MEVTQISNRSTENFSIPKGETGYGRIFFYAGTLLVLLLVRFLSTVISQKQKRRKSEDGKEAAVGLEVIRGPKPFFIKFIGSAYHLLPLQETLNKTLKWHKLYGSCMKAIGVNHTALVVFSAEIAQSFLKSGDLGHLSKDKMPFYDIMRPFLGNGLLISEGTYWQTRRKVLMGSMNFQRLRSYTKLLNKHSKRFVNALEKLFVDKGVHPINVEINSSFLAIITEILTGVDMDEKDHNEVAEYHHHFQTWKDCLISRIEKPWCLLDSIWRWHPKYRAHNIAVAKMNLFAIRRLEDYKLKKENSLKVGEGLTSESYLNSGFEEDGNFRSTLDDLVDAGVSDVEIIHEINTLLFGGHETTATTIHFYFFMMALHPDFQEICRKEIDEVFENSAHTENETLTFDSLANLKYVERCLLETMRLYPSSFGYMRYLKKSLNIDYEGKNVEVPAGTDIVLVPWVIHRSPQYYQKPEEFDPDRFLPDQSAKRHPYSYLPFSAGPRNCIGQKFGMNEMKTVAAYVLRNFELSTTDKVEDVTLLPSITLTPERDYNFILKRRL
ncbi:unnamed protein product [Orchesella dallaii]|uniref:Cytochrome P450 4C1 n=1 Tax=Orchesella dallaii TaxID=48710 RepID=A0ABP1QX35_9HEXA